MERFSGESSRNTGYTYEVKLVPIMALFVVLVITVFLGYNLDNRAPKKHVAASVVSTAKPKTPEAPPAPVVDPLASVADDMNAVINGQPLSASATLINLDTGKEYDAGKYTQTYEAASTSKLVAVFDYIHQVELGKATLAQTIQGQSAQDIIMRMLVNSDNDAWDKLNGYLKFSSEQSYLDSIGVAGKMVPSNIQFSTPAMAKLLQLLYQGKLMTADHQAMVYGYMSHTTMNKLIPAALPADATVYHKYGQIDGVLHDAAIVQYQGHNFILVIYTDGGQNTAQTNLIHAITTAAFNDVTKS